LSDYKTYRDAVGITNNDMIRALRGTFKRYGGATNAMVNNPDSYGVCLLPKAEKILAANFGYANGLSNVKQKPVRKACIRKKPNRLSVYLTDEMYSEIKAIMEREGYATVQEFLCKLLEDYVGG
jgi:hypothetical protein